MEPQPFDLGSAINLLRSFSAYPTSAAGPSPTNSDTTLPPDVWFPFSTKERLAFSNEEDDIDVKEPPQILLIADDGARVSLLLDEIPSGNNKNIQKVIAISSPRRKSGEKRSKKADKIDFGVARKPHVSNFTPDFRRANLLEKLLTDFNDLGPALLPSHMSNNNAGKNPAVHVFVDHSNILIGFYESLKKFYGRHKHDGLGLPTMSFDSLAMILERGRNTEKKVLVGSTRYSPSVAEAASLGYETSILTRVPKDDGNGAVGYSSSDGKIISALKTRKNAEQGVDELIHLKILESLLDFPPSKIVLATGDGNVAEFSAGFYKVVQRCLWYGWELELFSFKKSLSRIWGTLQHPRFQVVLLDEYLLDLVSSR